MRNNTVPIAAGLIALLLIGGLFTVWFIDNFEYVTEQVRGNMGTEARRNPLLAAEHYLSRIGIAAKSHTGRQLLIDPPSQPGLLLIRDLGPALVQNRVASLLDWVERGGNLVVTPGSAMAGGSVHPLLQQFAVTVESDDFFEEDETSVVKLPWRDVSLQIDFDPGRWFSVDKEDPYWTPGDTFPHLLRFPWGEGSVTFLSDSEFLTNDRIAEKDHALLLAYLAEESDQAWLLYNAQMPSLITYLWQRAPYLLITVAFVGVLTVWRLQQASGPLISQRETKHRDLLEHLQATAEFAWRHNPSVGLLEAARREVEKRWLSSHPLLHQLDETARCDWMAKHTGMTANAIYRALYSHQGETGQTIKTTINLQRLFAALHPDRKD